MVSFFGRRVKRVAPSNTPEGQTQAEEKLFSAAKADTALPDGIWTDKTSIGKDFTYLNNPVRNDMQVTVTYKNYRLSDSGDDVSTTYNVTDDSFIVVLLDVATVSSRTVVKLPTELRSTFLV